MTHRIVALSDTHLRATDPWNADRLASWDQVIEDGLALKGGVSCWLHAGDVFDAKSSIQDRIDAADRLQRMAAVAPVLVLHGNEAHCVPGDIAIFKRLSAKWPIVVAEAADVIEIELATGGAASVFALAYPQKSLFVSLGIPPDQIAIEAEKALGVLFMDAAAKLETARKRGRVTFMACHGTIAGSRISTGQPMIGHEISISPLHLARLGPILKVFGHIHLPQECHGAVYVGSGSRLSWGETEAKRFLIVDIADDSTSVYQSRPLMCPPRYHIEARLTRDAFDWKCTKGPDGPTDEPPTSWVGCDARCRFRYAAAERDVLAGAKARIAAQFLGVRRLDLEPIAISTREVRAPEVVSAVGLDDKLKAWARLSGVLWSAEIERCASLLLASEDGDPVVEETVARLSPLVGTAPRVDVVVDDLEEVRL